MNMAIFFQKYGSRKWVSQLNRFYCKFVVRSNRARISYLRDAGAKIGDGCTINSLSLFGTEPYLIEVGNNTYFSGNKSTIFTHDGGNDRLFHMGISPTRNDFFGKVKIGSNCFIGHDCIIMKHVTIGDNCIIGAGSVVTKSIPARSVAAGVPAKVICTVEEYYEKNKKYYDETIGWNAYKKRRYIEANMDKYEKLRAEREV